jgi:hypothetical protein
MSDIYPSIVESGLINELTETQIEVSQKSLALRKQKTSGEIVRYREGAKGIMFKYITRQDAFEWLDRNYACWSMEVLPDTFKREGKFFQVAVAVTVIDHGLPRKITCYGQDAIDLDKNGNEVSLTYAKNCESDAIKRIVSVLGGFSDVYSDKEVLDDPECDTEDFLWFLKSMPIIIQANDRNVTRIWKQIKAFYYGRLKKEKVINYYNIKEEG